MPLGKARSPLIVLPVLRLSFLKISLSSSLRKKLKEMPVLYPCIFKSIPESITYFKYLNNL